METTKPTDQETIKWLENQCFHMRKALLQTSIFLSRAYTKIEEQEQQIADLTKLKCKSCDKNNKY